MDDKEKHFVAGGMVYIFAMLTPVPPFSVVVLVACMKELFDWATGRGMPEVADVAATCLGGLVAQGVL